MKYFDTVLNEDAVSLVRYIIYEIKNNESFLRNLDDFSKTKVYRKFGQELVALKPSLQTKARIEVNIILFEYLFLNNLVLIIY